jgi:hypothetical protein
MVLFNLIFQLLRFGKQLDKALFADTTFLSVRASNQFPCDEVKISPIDVPATCCISKRILCPWRVDSGPVPTSPADSPAQGDGATAEFWL